MEIDQLVESFEFRFKASGVDNAKRVAEELLAHVLECKPLEIYTGAANIVNSAAQKFEVIQKLEPLAERIEQGEPLQYVLGEVDFWGLRIFCDPRALIPRPETELLVEEVLTSNTWTAKSDGSRTVLVDVGTGTGCIALTLAKQRSDADLKAVDISFDALELARFNSKANGLDGRIEWMENNLLDGFPVKSVDIVVANLPYIATDEWTRLAATVRDHEPRLALESGPTGMELIGILALQARQVLVPGGMLFLEFGYEQGASVFQSLERLGYTEIEIRHDLAGHERIAIAVNP